MGRHKTLLKEEKARNISISLSPKHFVMLDKLCRAYFLGPSDLVQKLIIKADEIFKKVKKVKKVKTVKTIKKVKTVKKNKKLYTNFRTGNAVIE